MMNFSFLYIPSKTKFRNNFLYSMRLYVRGRVTLQDEFITQLGDDDELVQEGGDILIYLDYYQWNYNLGVRYFPFKCPNKHKVCIQVMEIY